MNDPKPPEVPEHLDPGPDLLDPDTRLLGPVVTGTDAPPDPMAPFDQNVARALVGVGPDAMDPMALSGYQPPSPFDALEREIQMHLEKQKVTATVHEVGADGKFHAEKRPSLFRTEFRMNQMTVVEDFHDVVPALRKLRKAPEFLGAGEFKGRVIRRDNIRKDPEGKWIWDEFTVREAVCQVAPKPKGGVPAGSAIRTPGKARQIASELARRIGLHKVRGGKR